jgi:hypothetical protein
LAFAWQFWHLLKARADPMDEFNIVCLVKGEQKYIWLFTDSQRAETLLSIGKMASNPEVDFNWYDAARLRKQVMG